MDYDYLALHDSCRQFEVKDKYTIPSCKRQNAVKRSKTPSSILLDPIAVEIMGIFLSVVSLCLH